jgi:hypothetical protein
MRRSICVSEPHIARAGMVSTWKFHYTTAQKLPEGAKLKFDLLTHGRDIDWEVPSADLKSGSNVIYAVIGEDTILEAEEIETPESFVPQFEFTLPEDLEEEDSITIVIGALPQIQPKEWVDYGNESQLTVQRRRPFYLYIDPTGKGNYDEPEIFSIDIKGNKLNTIQVMTPSFVAKNKRFDITVRFEDEYGNLTNYAPEGTMIELSYDQIRENLNWKLFVPETGFVVLPNLYFNEAGIYRIRLENMQDKSCYFSAPIKCFNEGEKNLFWGLLHGETERVDSTENIENCLRHIRDERSIDFFATSPFDDQEETSNETWKHISNHIAEFNEEERFTSFLGFQYQGEAGKEGIHQILWTKDSKPLLRRKDAKSNTLQKIYKSHTPKEMIAIPTFTMGKGHHFDFSDFTPEFERVVEIYNAWGCNERTAKEGNPFPIKGNVGEEAKGSLISALKKNLRFGFVGGGLDDRGIYASFFEGDQKQYSPGLTGIIADKQSRESLLDALYNRRTFATTGARILLGFYIAGQPMGSELSTALKKGLMVNRHISGYVAGTDTLKTVEVIRNGEVIHTFTPNDYHFDYYYDDMDNLEKVALKEKKTTPFVFYYLRVTQNDGQMAWSSPIWVDINEKAKKE